MFIPKLWICLREGYTWKTFRADASAGIVVGLVALPLAMAFAIAAGLPPERGIYTAIVAGFIISLLGGSRVQIGGPTGAFVVIIAGVVANFGYPGLVLTTILAGVMLLIMGVTRLGEMVKYIPYPVTTGFTSGIAVVIFSSQIRDFLGLTIPKMPAGSLEQWKAAALALPSFNPWAFAIALGTTLLIFYWPKKWQKLPASVVALVVAGLFVAWFQIPVETIGSRFGSIPDQLPAPRWPSWSLADFRIIFSSAVTIALLGAIESLLSAVVADGMTGGRHKSSTELIAQGVANIVTPLFGGIPATGAIARTATNVRNGGRTPVAGIIHSAVLLVILLMAGPLAVKIPLAALSGILIVVCIHMAEWRSFRFVLLGPRSDRLVLLTTFLLTILIDLTVAVEVGVVLSAFLFMRSIANLTQVRALTHEGGVGLGGRDRPLKRPLPPGVEVYSIHGSFFFGAAHKIMEVGRFVGRTPTAVILDMTDVTHIDSSGLHVLKQMHRECQARSTRFMLAGVHAQPLFALEEAELVALLGESNLHPDLDHALAALP